MVNESDPDGTALALLAVSRAMRPAMAALFALDARLADIVRTTREPLVGQMRLTWWHDALTRLDDAPAPAEPLLRELQRLLLPQGVSGALLATMIDGWEALIVADPIDAAALDTHARARGEGLFAAAGRLLGGDSPLLAPAGRGWALADLAAHLSDRDSATRAADSAGEALADAFSGTWPRTLRPVGLSALIAKLDRSDLAPIVKALKVWAFRMTGR